MAVIITAEDLRGFAEEVVKKTVEEVAKAKEPEPTWMSATQVCSRMGVNRSTLWRWGKEGYLPGHKFGNRVRYKESDVCRVEAAEKGGVA